MNSVEKFLCSHGIPVVKDCSSKQFEEEIISLIDLAKREVMMTTTLDADFYNKSSIKSAFEGAVERGVAITILVDVRTDIRRLEKIEWLKSMHNEKKITLFWNNEETPHIMVVDKKHTREETHHEGNYMEATNEIMYCMEDEATINWDKISIWIKKLSQPQYS